MCKESKNKTEAEFIFPGLFTSSAPMHMAPRKTKSVISADNAMTFINERSDIEILGHDGKPWD